VLEQRVAGDPHSQFAEQPRPGLPSECERDVGEQPVQSLGSSSVMGNHSGQPFGEDCLFAGARVTEEPPDVKPNGNGDALPGQIRERSGVARMDPSGGRSAYTGQQTSAEVVRATSVMLSPLACT
jgi:hypothetical protein